jgi:hypothetical protein
MSEIRPSFKQKFEGIQTGWTSSQVRLVLGEPTEGEDTKVPDGSVWGTQPAMAYKIQSGEPVRQWMFHAEEYFHYVWFAKAGGDAVDPWKVTLKVRVPRRL